MVTRRRSDERSAERPSDDEVARYVERLAGALGDLGMPRMPTRVFACLLVDDDACLSAAELAERLHVSPAAISGAVRFLVQMGMIVRDRERGSRSDRYRLHHDVWAEMYRDRMALLMRVEAAVDEGARLFGRDRPEGRRLLETQEFFRYLRSEFPAFIAQWQHHRDEFFGDVRR